MLGVLGVVTVLGVLGVVGVLGVAELPGKLSVAVGSRSSEDDCVAASGKQGELLGKLGEQCPKLTEVCNHFVLREPERKR